jgi:hypothetical protein
VRIKRHLTFAAVPIRQLDFEMIVDLAGRKVLEPLNQADTVRVEVLSEI